MRRAAGFILGAALALAAPFGPLGRGAATPIDIPIVITGPPAAPGFTLSLGPPNATTPSSTAPGAVVSTITAMSSGGPPALAFGPPYFDDGGLFAISGNQLIINPAGAGVAALASSTQQATVTATAGGQTIAQNFTLAVSAVSTQVNFANAQATIPDNSGAGTFVATIVVTMSDGTTNYPGGFTTSNTDIYAISGNNVVTARQLTALDDGISSTIITATGP